MKQFNGVGAFCEFLAGRAAAAAVLQARGVHDAGQIVQEEAQAELGHYQTAAGPFAAWEPLAESTLFGWDDVMGNHYPGKIDKGQSPPDNPGVATAEMKHAIELTWNAERAIVGVPDETVGSGTEDDPVRNVGDIAIDFECGTKRQPPRSFLGRALFVKTDAVVATIGAAVASALTGLPYAPHTGHASVDEDIPF